MINVLYIGNKLHKRNSNPSYIDVLGHLLSQEGLHMSYASSYTNKALRLIHMVVKLVASQKRTDIVLIDTYSTQNFYYAYIISQLCRFLHLPYIPILHGGNLPSRLKASPKMSRAIFDHAKVNIAPSLYLKKAFGTFGYDNVKHIPNTLEIVNYHFEKKSFDTPRLLWVRSFSEIYNPELAITVFKLVKQIHPEAELCMVGPDADGTLATTKQKAKDSGLQVKFTGKLEKDTWIILARDYNIFLNTTNFDNMPVSVVEAMALGLPVISTNVGGMPYLIEHDVDGLLVPPNDSEAMAGAVNKLIAQTEWRTKIIEHARRKAEQWDWHHVKPQWLQTLK